MKENRFRNIYEIAFISLMSIFAITSCVAIFGDLVSEQFGGHRTTIFNFITYVKVYIHNIVAMIKSDNTPSFLAQTVIDGFLLIIYAIILVIVFINLIKGTINLIKYFKKEEEYQTKYFIRCIVYTLIVCQIVMTYYYYDVKSQGVHYGWAGIVSITLCSLTVFLYWFRQIFFISKNSDEEVIFLLKGVSSGLLLAGAILGTTKQFLSSGSNESCMRIVQLAVDYLMQGEIPETTRGQIDFVMTIISGILCFVGLVLTLLSFAKDIIPVKKNTMMTRLIVSISFTLVGSALCLVFYQGTYLGKGLIMMIIALVLSLAIEISLVIFTRKKKQSNEEPQSSLNRN